MLADGVEIRSCVTPVATVAGKSVTTLEGLPALYAEQKGLAQAPALHPLQQALIDEQAPQCGYCYNGMIIKGSELLSQNPRPTEAADPRPHERPPLPLRHLSARHEGDPARVHQNGGSGEMSAILTDSTFSRRDLLKGGGALIVGFSFAGGAAAPPPPRAATSPGRPTRTRSIPGSRCTPTTPRRSISARASSARATPPASCRSPAKSSIST